MSAKHVDQAPSEEFVSELDRMRKRQYVSIREYTIDLIKIVHHRDPDGRAIGLDYGEIRELVVKRFPVVVSVGPHKGHVTKISFKEIITISCELNRDGVKLPFRPRRKAPYYVEPTGSGKDRKYVVIQRSTGKQIGARTSDKKIATRLCKQYREKDQQKKGSKS
jgi:hypothetical protein